LNDLLIPREASKIANLLQGLTFPATKEEIKKYIVSGKAVTISYKMQEIYRDEDNNVKADKLESVQEEDQEKIPPLPPLRETTQTQNEGEQQSETEDVEEVREDGCNIDDAGFPFCDGWLG
jgi:hypothetical protein